MLEMRLGLKKKIQTTYNSFFDSFWPYHFPLASNGPEVIWKMKILIFFAILYSTFTKHWAKALE